VREGEKITQEQAEEFLQKRIDSAFVPGVNRALGSTRVTQNQFDALVSFAYNVGVDTLARSTLLRRVKANPRDRRIRAEFGKYVAVNGRKTQGLANRRKREADLYFSI
jgi:lysozyme